MTPAPARSKYGILAEINMIPFIDIALVLLIIFMVMTPFLIRAQIKVNLPDSASAVPDRKDTDALTIQVDRGGTIYVDGSPVAVADVLPTLRRLVRNPETQPLVIQADKEVAFERVVTVLDAGQKLGVRKMGVSVKPIPAGRAGR
jgi:biopolymer transport protein ExbD